MLATGGCGAHETTETFSEPSPIVEHATSQDRSGYDLETEMPSGPGLCEKYEKIVLADGDGGIARSMRIPLPCDPLWKMKDRGDPPFNER